MAFIKRFTDLKISPSRPGMATISFTLKLWTTDQKPDVDTPVVSQDFSREHKVGSATAKADDVVLRIKAAVKESVEGWIARYESEQAAIQGIQTKVEIALAELAGV